MRALEGVGAAAAVLTVLLVGSSAVTSGAHATDQTTAATTAQATRAADPTGFSPVAVREYWDVSGSLDSEVVRLLQPQLQHLDRFLARVPSVRSWELHPWGPMQSVMSPATRSLEVPAAPAAAACAEGAGEGRILKIIDEETQRECASKHEEARHLHQERLEALATQAAAARAALRFDQRAPQTCFWRLLHHLAETDKSRLDLVITDGLDEACKEPPATIGRPGGKGRILVVLVPSNADRSGKTDPLQRIEDIRRRAPEVRVLWAADVDSNWEWINE